DPESASDAAVPVPTLEFGRLCLRNTLALLPENASITPLTDEQEASGVMPELYPAGPSSPLRGTEVISLRVSALACSAYVCLCLADYSSALRHAENLLAAHLKIPGVYKILGHLYAGEALISLGRVAEAVTHFDPGQIGDISLSSSFDSTPSPTLLLPNDSEYN
ncbi:CCR4-NOT transcription complex subunit 10, partial [Halocaridina rubra]